MASYHYGLQERDRLVIDNDQETIANNDLDTIANNDQETIADNDQRSTADNNQSSTAEYSHRTFANDKEIIADDKERLPRMATVQRVKMPFIRKLQSGQYPSGIGKQEKAVIQKLFKLWMAFSTTEE